MIQVPPLITPVRKPLAQPRKHPTLLDPSCVAYYDFSRGPKLYDYSGKGNHGTITGATFVSKGRYGPALSFDGADDIINCGNDSSLDLIENDHTIAVWASVKTIDSQTIAIRNKDTLNNYHVGHRGDLGAYYQNRKAGAVYAVKTTTTTQPTTQHRWRERT